MAERATVTRRVRGGTARAKGTGQAALDRLTRSVEAAQEALKDLRSELGRGSRDVLRDLDTTLRDARKNLRSISKTVTKDLDNIQHALITGKPAPSRAARRGGKAATAPAGRRTRTGTKARTSQRPAKAPGATSRPAAASSEQTPSAVARAEPETSARE